MEGIFLIGFTEKKNHIIMFCKVRTIRPFNDETYRNFHDCKYVIFCDILEKKQDLHMVEVELERIRDVIYNLCKNEEAGQTHE